MIHFVSKLIIAKAVYNINKWEFVTLDLSSPEISLL